MTQLRSIGQRRDPAQAVRHGVIGAGILLTCALLLVYINRHEIEIDFRDSYWPAASAVLHGFSPYRWTRAQIFAGTGFGYPAFTGLVMAPVTLLPLNVATALFLIALLASVPVTLWVLGVREPAVYGMALLQWAVINAWQSGNLSLVLALLAALAWRYRERPVVCAALVTLAVSLKPFVWPLWLWLLATRRYRALGFSLAMTFVVNLAAFAVIGLGHIHSYLHLIGVITSVIVGNGYGVPALVMRVGGSEHLGLVVTWILAAGLAAVALRAGRRGHDVGVLAIACALALEASPLVWNHYFALLIVPVAIAEPRLGRTWVAMLPLWLCPALHVSEWQSVLAWAVTGLVVWMVLGSERRATRPVPEVAAAGASTPAPA